MIGRCLLSDKGKWYGLNLKFMEYEYKDENVWENPLEKGDPRKIFEGIIQDPASPDRLFLIEEGEKTIGFVNAAYLTSIWAHGKVLFIDDFFILEEFRERGYGKKALYDLEEKMMTEGYRCFQLLAKETNPKAIDSYDREKCAKQKINFFCKYL